MNNERAFPWCGDLNETPTINLGMTLRDYFAAQALGMKFQPHGATMTLPEMAAVCYEMADAMLKARGES